MHLFLCREKKKKSHIKSYFNTAEQIWPSFSKPLLLFKKIKQKKPLPNLNSSKLPKEINYKKAMLMEH